MQEITVFTPTYNRAETLKLAYISLKKQKSKNFKWLIVDDGSKDNTEEIVNIWKKEKIIEIQYIKKQNGGKHTAYNIALKNCMTNYMLVLDSDDILIENAICDLENYLKTLNMDGIWGIVGPKILKKDINYKQIEKKSIETKLAYIYKKYRGETYILLNLKIVKKCPFPIFDNEKLVPEDAIYNQLDSKYNIYWINDNIYIYEYREDGYTKAGVKNIINNCNGVFYANYIKAKISKYSVIEKGKAYARCKVLKKIFGENINQQINNREIKISIKIIGNIFYPLFLYHYNKMIKNKSNIKINYER